MSYTFEGRSFTSLEQWKREFPAYRSYPDLVKAGADTVQKIESAIADRARRWRTTSMAGARKSREVNPPTAYSRKRNLP